MINIEAVSIEMCLDFDIHRNYTQTEVCKILGRKLGKDSPISAQTFRVRYRSQKNFPKPLIDSKTYKVWSGIDLYNWDNGLGKYKR